MGQVEHSFAYDGEGAFDLLVEDLAADLAGALRVDWSFVEIEGADGQVWRLFEDGSRAVAWD